MDKKKVVACFGDSLVYGFPYGEEYSWLKTVEQLSGHKFLNFGCCGETTVDIEQRLRCFALPEKVDALLFFGGANDVLQLTPLPVSCEALKRVLALAEAETLPLCVVLPLISGEESVNDKLCQLRKEFARIAAGKAKLLDLMPSIGEDAEEIKGAYLDGFHPKAIVYEKMGKYAAQPLAEWLEKSEE